GISRRRNASGVMRPNSWPSPSTTGTPSARRSTIREATSPAGVSGETVATSVVMISRAIMGHLQFLGPHPQHLGHAPRLGKTAPGPVGRIAVEDLGHLSQGGLGPQVVAEPVQYAPGHRP